MRADVRHWSFAAALLLHATVFAAPFVLRNSVAAYEPNAVHVFLLQGQTQAPEVAPPKRARQKVERRTAPTPPAAPQQHALAAPPPDPTPVREPPADAAPAAVPPVALPRFDPAYLNNQAPAYPTLSRRLGEQGRVLLRVFVRPDGTAQEVLVSQSSGIARLDNAARLAVGRWKFVPAHQGEAAVGAWVIVPISFSLEG